MKKKEVKYIIPYVDQDMKFWEKLSLLYGDKIKEVYFPFNDEIIGTGRPKQPEKHLTSFLESRILPVSTLINPVVLPRPVEEISNRVLNRLENYLSHYNLVGVTLTNLSLAKNIRDRFPSLNLSASTLMEIYNEQQLCMINDVFDNLVPSTRIIRDKKSLKAIRKGFKGQIRLMVNESCLSSCVYRTQHFFEMSNPGIHYPHSLCTGLLAQQPWLRLTGGWVLPQHLHLFDGLYDDIKIAGRVALQNQDRYFKILESYINNLPLQPRDIGGGPASINHPMDINTEFYQYTLNCKKNCVTCSVCKDYWTEKTAGLTITKKAYQLSRYKPSEGSEPSEG